MVDRSDVAGVFVDGETGIPDAVFKVGDPVILECVVFVLKGFEQGAAGGFRSGKVVEDCLLAGSGCVELTCQVDGFRFETSDLKVELRGSGSSRRGSVPSQGLSRMAAEARSSGRSLIWVDSCSATAATTGRWTVGAAT